MSKAILGRYKSFIKKSYIILRRQMGSATHHFPLTQKLSSSTDVIDSKFTIRGSTCPSHAALPPSPTALGVDIIASA